MTSKDLLKKMTPSDKHTYIAQLNSKGKGLDFNHVDMFSRLIKDAARCNEYNSDIYYDMQHIEDRMQDFNPDEEFEPIWIGFRKMGVDCTAFILSRCEHENVYGSLSSNYFALYSINVDLEETFPGFYDVVLSEYVI